MQFKQQRRQTLKHLAAGAGALALGKAVPALAQQGTLKVACVCVERTLSRTLHDRHQA